MRASRNAALSIVLLLGAIAAGGLALRIPAARAETATQVEPADAEARAPVVRLQDKLIDVMKRADGLGFEGRRRELAPVVEETFDIEFMARTSIGRAWLELTPELRSRWVECFSRYTASKFADQFKKFSGQKFVLHGERPASHGTRVVMTSLERVGREPVRLDFRVQRGDSGWQIIDVYGKGTVSELALRRSEYEPILKDGGIERLIETVDALTARTASKSAS